MSVNDINFVVTYLNAPICLGDTLKVYVTVSNKGRESLNGAYIHFPGDSYFQESHEYINNSTATLYLRPWAYPTVEKLNSTLNFYLYNKDKKLLRSTNYIFRIGNLKGL